MRRGTYRATFLLTAFAPLLLYACGALKSGDDRGAAFDDDAGDAPFSQSDTGKDPRDDAHGEASTDAGTDGLDASIDAKDGAPFSSVPVPLALGSSDFFVDGFTSDGWIAYTENHTSISVVPLAGGAPIVIYAEPADSSDTVTGHLSGNVLSTFVGNVAGPRQVWSHATGLHTISVPVNDLVASNDGTRMVYSVVETTADGSLDVYTMESGVDLSNPIRLPGTRSLFSSLAATGDHFVLETKSSPDPKDYSFSVESYTNGGAQTTLFENEGTTVIRIAGGAVVLNDSAGHLLRRTVNGGPTATFELPADAGTIDLSYVLATQDGSRLVFADNTGQFWSSPTASPDVKPIPGMVLTSAFPSSTTYLALAPNGSHFAAYAGATALIGPTAAGNVVPLPAPSGSFHFGASPTFSGDSRYLYTAYPNILNELNAVAVDTGATSRITFDVDCNAGCWRPAHGATVLYMSKGSLYADDADNPGHPTKLADSVTRFWTNDEGTVVVYLFNDPNSEAASGLFAIGVP